MRRNIHFRDFPLTEREHILRALEEAGAAVIQENVSLQSYTSFHIGGPASFFASVSSAESLSALLKAAARSALPVLFVGGGTNLLIDDRGFDGLAVKLDLNQMTLDEERRIAVVEAGVKTSTLVERAVQAGLSGLAFAAGLPGSVGGGLAGNAGCFGRCLSDTLVGAQVISKTGDVSRIASMDWFQFRYRRSCLLETSAVLTEATFSFSRDDKEALRKESDAAQALRQKKHPAPGTFTAGSFFKNLPPKNPGEQRIAAGLLLDQVGAKDMSVGDAAVFERHANIVVNKGNATSSDVRALTEAMHLRVLDRFGVHLEPEVRYVSPVG